VAQQRLDVTLLGLALRGRRGFGLRRGARTARKQETAREARQRATKILRRPRVPRRHSEMRHAYYRACFWTASTRPFTRYSPASFIPPTKNTAWRDTPDARKGAHGATKRWGATPDGRRNARLCIDAVSINPATHLSLPWLVLKTLVPV